MRSTLTLLLVLTLSGCLTARNQANVEASQPVLALSPAEASAARADFVAGLMRDAAAYESSDAGRRYRSWLTRGILTGVIAGVTGFAINSDLGRVIAATGSLASGGIAAYMSATGLDTNSVKRDACLSLLRRRATFMDTRWDLPTFTAAASGGIVNQETYRAYQADVDQTLLLLEDVGC